MSEYSMAELRDMAPAYVAGALSAEENADFETALGNSTELAQEVAEYRQVIERVVTTARLAPPPALRDRFLQRIANEKPAVVAPVSPPQLTVVDGNRNVRPRANWWLPTGLGVAMAASLVFAVMKKGEVDSLRTELQQRDSVVAARDAQLKYRLDELNTILMAEGTLKVVHLVANNSTEAGIQFYWNMKEGRGLIHAFHLKPAPNGRAYQLWLIKDGKPVPVKVFNSDPDGHGIAMDFKLPTDMSGVSVVAVTEEPEGGSPQPTTTPFLVGKVGI